MNLLKCILSGIITLLIVAPVAAQPGPGGAGYPPGRDGRSMGPGMAGPGRYSGGGPVGGYGTGGGPVGPTRFGGSPQVGRMPRPGGPGEARSQESPMPRPSYGRPGNGPEGGPDFGRGPVARNPAQRMEKTGPELPVQDRIQLPLIDYKYRQGEKLMDEGRNQQDNSKIRMGLQQINQANERLEGMGGYPGRGQEMPSGKRR